MSLKNREMLFVKPGHLYFDKSHSQQIIGIRLGEVGKWPPQRAEAEVNPDSLLYNKATAIGK